MNGSVPFHHVGHQEGRIFSGPPEAYSEMLLAIKQSSISFMSGEVRGHESCGAHIT